MSSRYSLWSLARQALRRHRDWAPAWRTPVPKPAYDIIIIGGGGHGLATAYFLAKKHGIRNVAVLERGWIGGGNSGRNTQVVRSNYFYKASVDFFEHSLKLYESLSRELNFNIMLSQRGIVTLAHSRHDLETNRRWANAILLNGVDSEILTAEGVKRIEPLINLNARFPVYGGFVQHRGGLARHDAVNWGFARAADALGVDILQNCPVSGFETRAGRIAGVATPHGVLRAGRFVINVAGHSSVLAEHAGLRLPLISMALQAMVTEPVKPMLRSIVLSPTAHVYASQSDRGEIVIGGAADVYSSYAQRGSLAVIEDFVAAAVELFPAFARLKLMRHWAGIVDISPDTSPIMGKTPVDNLYLNCGWGTGGFKAIPAGGDTMAFTVANDRPHPLIAPFALDRFERGALIDEGAAAGVAH
ncbi:MAG TPA: sarcosine oxidase subunit beta family protein [Steroidobacteraceae bacterium]|nr:sarcosine oxidase subunit beta family protein [Steroidobacteraceae bacterium]